MSVIIRTPPEIAGSVAQRVRELRLRRGWTQAEIAERAGISRLTYRAFERTGKISLERLLSIAIALGRAGEWDDVFALHPEGTLDDLDVARPGRKRGSRARERGGA